MNTKHVNIRTTLKIIHSKEKPWIFDIRKLLPELLDQEVAEKLANHFSSMAGTQNSLGRPDSTTYSSPLPYLSPELVAKTN